MIKKHLLLLSICIIAIVYIFSFYILPPKGFWICDNGMKFLQMKAILSSNYKTFALSCPSRELIHSYKYCSFVHPFSVVKSGLIFGVFSATFSLLSTIPYALFGYYGLYIIPLFSTFLMLPALIGIARFLSKEQLVQSLCLLIVALCTPVWFYSMTFWEHMPAVCLAMWSLFFILKYLFDTGRKKDIIASAIFCGLAIYFRDDMYLLGIIFCFLFFFLGRHKWRLVLLWGIIFTVTLLPLWCFQWLKLGSPLGIHVTSVSPFQKGWEHYFAERWEVIKRLILNSHKNQILSVVASLPFLVSFLLYPLIRIKKFGRGIILFSTLGLVNGLIITIGHLSSESPMAWILYSNGLFATSPVLLFAFMKNDNKDTPYDKPALFLWSLMFGFIVLYVIIIPLEHSKGLNWGCRLLMVVIPILGVMSASAIVQWWKVASGKIKFAGIILLSSLFFTSIFLQIYSIHLLRERKIFVSRLNHEIAMRPEDIIVTNVFFASLDLAPQFDNKIVLLANNPLDRKIPLYSTLKQHGIKRVLLVLFSQENLDIGGMRMDDSLNYFSFIIKSIEL
ncbi:MAG: hypothetical protein AB1454_14525 [Candidatus Auribacterota bacterium]